jgi:hypothetical protein
VSALHWYAGSTNTANNVILGIYTDDGGAPSFPKELLGECNTPNPTAATWNACSVQTPVSIAAGAVYWLAILQPIGSTGTVKFRDCIGCSANSSDGTTILTFNDLDGTWAGTGLGNAYPALLWAGGLAGGLQVASRSDTLSNSQPSATSNHTFAFTVNNSISGGDALTLKFPLGFVAPTLDCGDVDAATSSQFNFNYSNCAETSTAWGLTVQSAALIQQRANKEPDSNPHLLTFLSNNTARNTIIAAATCKVAISSISDTQGNAYVSAVGPTTSPGGMKAQIWYASNIKAGANTVTVNCADSSGSDLYIFEYSGLSASNALDATSAATGTPGPMNSGAFTTDAANTFLFGFGVTDSGTASAGTTFTYRDDFDGNITEDKMLAAFGTYTATASISGSGWSMSAAAFKTSGGLFLTLKAPSDSSANVHVATSTPITIKIGSNATVGQQGTHWITNPSTAGIYTISVGGTFGGSGNMLVSINAGVQVSATVAESLALTVSSVPGSIQLVQAQGNYCSSCGSVSVTPTKPIAGNDLLIVFGLSCAPAGCNPASTISDTANNTWTLATTYDAGLSAHGELYMWYTCAAKSGNDTIKLTNSSNLDQHVHVLEVSGIAASNCLDQLGMSLNNRVDPAGVSTSSTVSQANEYVAAYFTDWDGNSTWTAGSGYTQRVQTNNAGTGDSALSEDDNAKTGLSGIQTATATYSLHSSDFALAVIGTFKGATSWCTADDGATVNAIGTTATSVAFGTISPNTFYQGCQDLIVSTNAVNGYSVTVQESSAMKTTNGQFMIPDTTCDAGGCTVVTATTWVTPTKNGLGHTCVNQSGSDCNATYGNGQKFKPLPNVAAGTAPVPITVIQTASTTLNSLNVGSTQSGNLLVVAASYSAGTLTGITDNATGGSNTYVSVGANAFAGPGSPNGTTTIWYVKNSKPGATTITPAESFSNIAYTFWEFSGADTSAPLDATSTLPNQSVSLTPVGPSLTNTQPGELTIPSVIVANNITGIHAGNAFTNDSTAFGDGFAHLITKSSGTFQAQWDQDVSGIYASNAASFKPATIASTALMSNTGTVTNSTGRVKYRLSAGSAQPAGIYTTIITYTIYAAY